MQLLKKKSFISNQLTSQGLGCC